MYDNFFWTNKNKIIFKPYFNQSLDNFMYTISKYEELIFSDFPYSKNMLKIEDYIYYKEYKNDPDKNELSIFNKPINFISPYTTKIVFNYKFNKDVKLHAKFKSVIFGDKYNQPINLTHSNNLNYLVLGLYFNQEFVNLPSSLEFLYIRCDIQSIVDNLPNSIKTLQFGLYFNSDINNLPNSVKEIFFHPETIYTKKINNLPNWLEYLKLPHECHEEIVNLPNSLKSFKVNNSFDFNTINVSNSIEEITLPQVFTWKNYDFSELLPNLKIIKCVTDSYVYNFIKHIKPDDYKQYKILTYTK